MQPARNRRATRPASALCVSLLAVLLPVSSAARAQDRDPFLEHVRSTQPLSPEEERATFRLPPGFEIQLVASEPEIQKPMNLAFDARGRLWVSGSVEYPYAAPADRPGRDEIKVLEDNDADGYAETVTTFADGLNVPIGLYPYKDGVIAWSIPYIWFLRDKDGDGKADSRERLYGPLGYERDTHGMNNAFRRVFDGWLYICHGYNNQTTVSGTDGHAIRMQSGNTYRVRLDGSRVEHFTWGQVNPFGMAFDAIGNQFTADCHSAPIYQLVHEGYYPSFGKPHDGLGFVPPMMTHSHGSTAICGLAYYDADNFPPEFRGNLFVGNVMTCRVHRDALAYDGSTITAEEAPDLVATSDPWFRPVDLRVGPDGALYIADFYNRIIGHYEVPLDHPGRDRHRGRIWRVVYTGADPLSRPARGRRDLTTLALDELVAALDDPVLTQRTLATNHLVDAHGKDAVAAVAAAVERDDSPRVVAHGLWVLHRLGALTGDTLARATRHGEPSVRVHAQKILAETPSWSTAQRDLALRGLDDANGFVARAAADGLARHPHAANVAPLLARLGAVPERDVLLRHVIRIALRDQLRTEVAWDEAVDDGWSEEDARVLASLAPAVASESAAVFLLEHVQRHDEDPDAIARYLAHAARHLPAEKVGALEEFARARFEDDADFQLQLLESIRAGLEQRGGDSRAALGAWAKELAMQLLATEQGDLAWTNVPFDDERRSTNPWVLELRPSNDGVEAAPFFGSLPRGEQLTGTLRSRSFPLPAELSFFIAGHDGFPNRKASGNNFARLLDADTGDEIARAPAPRNDLARRVRWDLSAHRGRSGVLEIVDGDTGTAFAWIAAGRFEPAVLPYPSEAIGSVDERRAAGARLARTFRIEAARPRLRELMRGALDSGRRGGAYAAALAAFLPRETYGTLALLVEDGDASPALRRKAALLLCEPQAEAATALTREALQSAPGELQRRLAVELVSAPGGTETLLALIAEGKVSARLLRQRAIRERLVAVGGKDAEERIEELTASLPDEDEEATKAIAQHVVAFSKRATDPQLGKELYAKHCVACHKLGDEGTVVGPQLDGIGLRGLERVLEDILDPNRNVDVAFRAETVVLADGNVLSGLHRRDEGETIVFANSEGKEFTVECDQVLQRTVTESSLMPQNFAETLSEDDVAHLVAFLLEQTTPAEGGEGGR